MTGYLPLEYVPGPANDTRSPDSVREWELEHRNVVRLADYAERRLAYVASTCPPEAA